MILWKQVSQLNLIMWHVLKFSIKVLANFKMFAQKMTYSKILVQNLTCFQKFDSKCQAARKLDWENVLYFTKNYQNQGLRESTKVPHLLLSQWKMTQRTCFLCEQTFQKLMIFHKNIPFKIWCFVITSIQVVTGVEKTDSKSDAL